MNRVSSIEFSAEKKSVFFFFWLIFPLDIWSERCVLIDWGSMFIHNLSKRLKQWKWTAGEKKKVERFNLLHKTFEKNK